MAAQQLSYQQAPISKSSHASTTLHEESSNNPATQSFSFEMMSIKNMLALIPVLATLANAGNAPDCNRFPGQEVSKTGALQGLNKIYNGAGDTCGSNDDGSCNIHACRNGAGIYVCAANPGHSTPQCRDVADLASNIIGECANGDAVEGNILSTTNDYFVDVRPCTGFV